MRAGAIFHDIAAFDGDKRTCRATLAKRREYVMRRRVAQRPAQAKQRQQGDSGRAAAADDHTVPVTVPGTSITLIPAAAIAARGPSAEAGVTLVTATAEAAASAKRPLSTALGPSASDQTAASAKRLPASTSSGVRCVGLVHWLRTDQSRSAGSGAGEMDLRGRAEGRHCRTAAASCYRLRATAALRHRLRRSTLPFRAH